MSAQWKDPDTGINHQIRSRGMGGLPTRHYRKVTMRCGHAVLVDDDDGSLVYDKLKPIARPWVTTPEAPTCLACVTEPEDTIFRNDWKIRGA